MIVVLVIFFLIVLFLCLFFGMNAHSITQSFWFFKNYSNISTSVLVIIAFASGIVFSILLVLIYKFKVSLSSSKETDESKEEVPSQGKKKKRARRPFAKNNNEPVNDTSDITYKG